LSTSALDDLPSADSAKFLVTGPADRYGYLPLQKSRLISELAAWCGKKYGQKEEVERLLHLLDILIHLHNRDRLEKLKEAYADFDPDREIDPLRQVQPTAQSHERAVAFLSQFEELVKRANFIRLSDEEVRAAIEHASHYGLRVEVDFDSFDAMHVYARGEAIERRWGREWKKLYRQTLLDTPIYKRMVVALRMKPTASSKGELRPQYIYLKMFKDIPKVDIEMLLPTTSVHMSWIDKGQIFVPTLSGLAFSLYKIALALYTVTALSVAALWTIGGLMAGSIGYALKTFFGYARTRDRYQLRLTRRLFFQNLYNNAALLFRLQDAAEGQEFREASLAYVFLLGEGVGSAVSQTEVGRRVEQFLREQFDLEVEFDVSDALNSLVRLGLASVVTEKGETLWKPVDPARAIELLEHNVTHHVGL
jgi:hypothetical protein